MDDVIAALSDQHVELDELLGTLGASDWGTPTPRCPGWVVADVVLHLAQTDEMALASLRGGFHESLEVLAAGIDGAGSVGDGAAALVASQRGEPPELVLDRWRTASAELRAAFAATDASARVQWVVGEMAARTLATTRLAECWIHTGDVLTAFARPIVSSRRMRHIARLAWRTLPYAFASAGRELAGPVQFSLVGPADEVWELTPDAPALTTVTGSALDLCQVAGQRAVARSTGLTAEGPDAAAVLQLVRTFA